MGIFSEAHEEEIDTLTRERAAFLDERNQTRRELEGVRERMNALAVSNAKLSDNGRIESYLQTLQSLTQLAKDVGIPDAESTGHDTLVVQLREKYIALLAQVAANQEAADVLRLAKEIEDNHLIPDDRWQFKFRNGARWESPDSRMVNAIKLLASHLGITLPAKDEKPN